MHRVTSKDGTSIAYDRQGSGPAVVLVGGAAVDRSENAPLATELAERFTVYNYARRGRDGSGMVLSLSGRAGDASVDPTGRAGVSPPTVSCG